MKLFRLNKIRLNVTYNKVSVRKNLSGAIPIQNGLKQGDALSLLLFNVALKMPSRRFRIEWNTSAPSLC
jgi:hypothetical protein